MELHAQLSCSMPRDSRMIRAGWQARAVYVEAVLYCRENLTDGIIDRLALPFWMPDMGARTRIKHLDRLTEVGALVQVDEGWRFPDHVWQKWNPSKAEVDEKRAAEAQRKADYRARKRTASDHPDEPSGHASEVVPMGQRVPTTSRPRQPEPEPEPEPEPYRSQSSAQLNTENPQPVDDDDFTVALELIVDAKIAGRQVDNPTGYRMRVRTNTIDEHGALIRMLLDDGNTPELTARHVLGVNLEHTKPAPIPWCDTECECDGTGFTETARGFAPCPHRHEITG